MSRKGVVVVVVAVAFALLAIGFRWGEIHPDYETRALSYAFTPEGAKMYAAACKIALVSGQPVPLVERWASAHPYDVDTEAGDRTGVCQCIARTVLAQKAGREVRY